jgi:serine-type D-Ala-D-Ala carboxypeptidase
MKFTTLEKVLIEKIKPAIVDVTPGVHIKAYQGGRLACDVTIGETYPVYDLASLTKIIFNQQKFMQAYDQGLWTFETSVKSIRDDFFDENIMVRDLLTHTAGLEWWKPFFKELWPDGTQRAGLDWREQRKKLWMLLNSSSSYAGNRDQIKTANPANNSEFFKSVYSDLDIMIMSFVLEKLFSKNLLEIWENVKDEFYPNSTFHFNLNNSPSQELKLYAPTEHCLYRKKTVRGEVHDENTWALGGVSNHSGLFGTADDVATYGLLVRSQLLGIAKYKIRQKTAQLFAQRAVTVEQGDWAMGYMLPSPDRASCGNLFSIHSIGHTGFTGTSLWYDQRRDLLVVILSNRLNYGRENQRYVKLRPQIHTWIYEATERNLSI